MSIMLHKRNCCNFIPLNFFSVSGFNVSVLLILSFMKRSTSVTYTIHVVLESFLNKLQQHFGFLKQAIHLFN